MTISKAQKKFKVLKNAILKDGKVEFNEAKVLLDFIDSYVQASNTKFVEFKKLLVKCSEDGKITDDESKILVSQIDSISSFLTIEAAIEKAFVAIIGIVIICVFAYKYCM